MSFVSMFLIALVIAVVSFNAPIAYPQVLHWTMSQGTAPLAFCPTCSTASKPFDIRLLIEQSGHLVFFCHGVNPPVNEIHRHTAGVYGKSSITLAGGILNINWRIL